MCIVRERHERIESHNLLKLREKESQLLAPFMLAWIAQSNGEARRSSFSAEYPFWKDVRCLPGSFSTLLLSSEAIYCWRFRRFFAILLLPALLRLCETLSTRSLQRNALLSCNRSMEALTFMQRDCAVSRLYECGPAATITPLRYDLRGAVKSYKYGESR
jgi:hypothetical protein